MSPPGPLAGVAEVAEMFGVHKNTVLAWAKRADFPGVLDRLATGPVWSRDDVEAWAKANLPLPKGRPRKAEA